MKELKLSKCTPRTFFAGVKLVFLGSARTIGSAIKVGMKPTLGVVGLVLCGLLAAYELSKLKPEIALIAIEALWLISLAILYVHKVRISIPTAGSSSLPYCLFAFILGPSAALNIMLETGTTDIWLTPRGLTLVVALAPVVLALTAGASYFLFVLIKLLASAPSNIVRHLCTIGQNASLGHSIKSGGNPPIYQH